MLKPHCSKFSYQYSLFLAVILSFVLLSQSSCTHLQETRDRRDRAKADLDIICKNIPIPSDFIRKSSERHIDFRHITIFNNYKSDSSCNVVGEHFRSFFIKEDWDRDLMQVWQSHGGMETLNFDFRRGDYLVSIACQNDVIDEAEKIISVSCDWRLR